MTSVIIPTLNEAQALPKLLAQFTPDLIREFGLEIIVSDGGSSDGTVALARKYGVTVVEHMKSQRQTIAQGRNAGATAARGDILVFIDADTMVPQVAQWLRRVGQVFQNPNVVAASVRFAVAPAERTLADWFWQNVFNVCFFCLNLSSALVWGGGIAKWCVRARSVSFTATAKVWPRVRTLNCSTACASTGK